MSGLGSFSGMLGCVRLLLVRHAQSSNNATISASGSRADRIPEPHITDIGIEQTHLLAATLPAHLEGPVRLTSSLMTRGLQTGAILADALDVPLHTLPDLHESGGIYDAGDDGTLRQAVHAPPLAELRKISERVVVADDVPDPWWVGPYEPRADRAARARRVVDTLRTDEPGTHVVVIHQHFGQDLVKELLGIEQMSGYVRIHNTGASLFEWREDFGAHVAWWINRTDHLPPDLLTV